MRLVRVTVILSAVVGRSDPGVVPVCFCWSKRLFLLRAPTERIPHKLELSQDGLAWLSVWDAGVEAYGAHIPDES